MSTKIKAGTATTGAVVDADATGILELQSGSTPTTALTIDASRNVGIGTSSPSYQLHISGTTPILGFTDTDTTAVSYIQASSGNGSLVIAANENATGSSSVMTFRNLGAERMRIDSSGNLLVGQTAAGAQASGGFSLTVGGSTNLVTNHSTAAASGSGYAYYCYNAGIIGSITQNGTTAVSYNTASDYRLKENVAPMTGALDVVQQLKPVTYNWRADGSSGQGFIAHELQAVVPDCVTGEKDAVDEEGKPVYQGIDTSFLVATLTKAIQELKEQVDAQALEIQALKGVA